MSDESTAKLIGLVGGVASGKSFVAEQMQALGAAVLDADRMGHEVLRLPEVEDAARQRWGEQIFGPDGHIQRPRLAAIVFAPTAAAAAELSYLEQLTHPKIAQRLADEIAELRKNPALEAIVLDAPVMLKAGWNGFCDHIVYVEAPREIRLARARNRGWDRAEFDRRESAQESLEVKRKLADVTIDNSNSAASTRSQIQQFWPQLSGRPKPSG